jgi:hypothetical protein
VVVVTGSKEESRSSALRLGRFEPGRLGSRVRAAFGGAVFALPTTIALAGAIAIAWQDRGSIAASDFLPWALLTALVLAAVLLAGEARRLPRDAAAAVVFFVVLAIWAGVSGTWAPVPSLARDEALLEAFGVLALVTALVTLRGARDKLLALGVFAGGLALVAVATAAQLHGSIALDDVFRYRRLSFPITYANAAAGFFLVGFWPAVVLAGRRAAAPWRRALAGGASTALLACSLLAQSKGALIGLGLSVLAVAIVSPARLRLLLGGLIAAAPVAAAFGPLVRPYRASSAAIETVDVHGAATATIVAAIAGAVLAGGWALADRRVRIGAVRRRLVGRVVLGLAVLAAITGAGTFVAVTHHPERWFAHQWRTFKHPDTGGSTHLVELGSNRYDFWRVSLDEFRDHPVAGGGARSFGPAYLVHGRSGETPARAHSLPLELLAEDGLVGFLLAVGGFGVLLVGLGRRARARSAAANAGFAGCILVLGQACVDWTFTFPAITVPFFLLAGIGLADEARTRVARRTSRAGAAVCVVGAVVVLAPPWLSAKLVRDGLNGRDGSDLRWAHRLDPVSVDPLVAEAQIAPSAQAALPPLRAALGRAPRSVQVRYVLGSVLWNAGRRQEALSQFEAAHALAPRDPTVAAALAVVRSDLRSRTSPSAK